MSDKEQGSTSVMRLEFFEKLARVLREWVTLLILLAAGLLLLPLLPGLAERLGQAQVTDLELPGGIKLKLQKAQSELTAALRTAAPRSGPGDAPASPADVAAAQAVQAIGALDAAQAAPLSGWAYAGGVQDGRWFANPFGLDGVPAAGQTLTTRSAVYLRTTSPDQADGWQLGAAVSALPAGHSVSVQDVQLRSTRDGRQWLWLKLQAQ